MPEPPFYDALGMPFIELQSVDSTNNYAFKQIHAGLAHHGTTYFAREQLEGKGQRGKTWTAAKDAGLILSIVLEPRGLPLTQQFQLSAGVAVAVCEVFSKYAGDSTRIKWPNDLYWQDRKAGGILIENIIGGQNSIATGSGSDLSESEKKTQISEISNLPGPASAKWLWAVVGIGININQQDFPEQLTNPVSLLQITGNEYNPVDLARELCLVLDRKFRDLINAGFESLYRSYLSFLYKKNERVKLKKGSRVFEATIKSVSTGGKLIVHHAFEEEFDFGEIDWIMPVAGPSK